MNTMMGEGHQRAYRFIKDRDMPNLREVVTVLKSKGLEVYISGSALMVPEYGDIDLLMCDRGYIIPRAEDERDFFMSPRAQAAMDDLICREGVNLKKREIEYGGGYAGSVINGCRWELDYRGSPIDISYAQEPFGMTRQKLSKLETEMGFKMDMEIQYELL